jgi:hypothetical protein
MSVDRPGILREFTNRPPVITFMETFLKTSPEAILAMGSVTKRRDQHVDLTNKIVSHLRERASLSRS